MTDVLSEVADTILEKEVTIQIDSLSPGLWEKCLIRAGIVKAQRSFTIKPAVLGTMIEISKLVLKVGLDKFKSESMLGATYDLYRDHGDSLARIVGHAICNNETGPSNKLISFLKWNLTAEELMGIVGIVVKQLDVVNFISTIVSIRGTSLLKTEGTIASGEQSAD